MGWKRAPGEARTTTGSSRASRANRLRKWSSRPKITEGRRMVVWRSVALGRQDQLLGLAFGAQVHAGGGRIGLERAHVHQPPYAVPAARLDDLARQLHVDALEVPVQDADQVDDRVGRLRPGGRAWRDRERLPSPRPRSAAGSAPWRARGCASGRAPACRAPRAGAPHGGPESPSRREPEHYGSASKADQTARRRGAAHSLSAGRGPIGSETLLEA